MVTELKTISNGMQKTIGFVKRSNLEGGAWLLEEDGGKRKLLLLGLICKIIIGDDGTLITIIVPFENFLDKHVEVEGVVKKYDFGVHSPWTINVFDIKKLNP